MKLKSRIEQKATVLSITGAKRVAANASTELRAQLEGMLVVGGMNYIVEFDEVIAIDSTGLSALIGFYQRIMKNGGELILVGIKNSVKLTFELTRLHEVFSFAANVDTAVSSCRSALSAT